MKVSRNQARLKRKKRVRVKGTKSVPRLVVFRSLKIIYAGLIDDEQGHTLAAADSRQVKRSAYDQETARAVGKLLAEKAQKKGIKAAVFDRAGYQYHGKVKALAEGAREAGLQF